MQNPAARASLPTFARAFTASSVLMQGLGKSTIISLDNILKKRTSDDYLRRKTKIICTMGPACWDVDTLVEMIDAGMNVARLNFSHGDHETHARTAASVHEALKRRPGRQVALLLDTKGPEIRTGLLKDHEPITLTAGQKLRIVTDMKFVGDSTTIACSYPKLGESVKVGSNILIADGSVTCEVIEVGSDYVMTIVKNGAKIGEKKNMNLPNVKVRQRIGRKA